MDLLGSAFAAPFAGFAGGVLLGLAARRDRFCTLGAIEDAIYGQNWLRIRMWALALAVAIAGTFLFDHAGAVDRGGSLYARMTWNPVSVIGGPRRGGPLKLLVHDRPLVHRDEALRGRWPVAIRTASGKSKLWYRHAGERRLIRPIAGWPVDILGSGFTIAPPSERPDLGTCDMFVKGSLDDVARLPPVRARALDGLRDRSVAEATGAGDRNAKLFRWCMGEARHCDDVETLIDAATTWASGMPVPLPLREVEKAARSAWRYEERGENYVGLKRPQINTEDTLMDELSDEPEAFFLFKLFERYHGVGKTFAISPSAMAKARNPPWHRTRIEHGRDVLVERRRLRVVAPPDAARRMAGRYRLAMPDSGNNHYTPAPQGTSGS